LASSGLRQHPLFAPLTHRIGLARSTDDGWAADSWLWVSDYDVLRAHPTRKGSIDEWTYVLAHGLLHFAFGHLVVRPNQRAWNVACDYAVARFLADLKLGQVPPGVELPREFPVRTEESLYQQYVEQGIPATATALGTAGVSAPDMVLHETLSEAARGKSVKQWKEAFTEGLILAVTSAVNVAGGVEPFLGSRAKSGSRAERARQWFINSYPLLGAMASSFTVYEDPHLCQRMAISVAAVHEERREIYFNPAAGLSELECRFVMAHELLHVGLRHTARCEGRDHYLWNVACDYVINGWLIEMEVGDVPAMGLLHDPALKGESAESVYDRIAMDLRAARKLCTLRGIGRGDMLEPSDAAWRNRAAGVELDEFCRRAMANGLTYHQDQGRGLIPADLIEEINALAQPPIPWDVALAMWFDHHFPPLERNRSYARPSRRQNSTPDIPRPRHVPVPDGGQSRTFGVVLDTSGSMDRSLLGKALGAIASYAIAHDVPAVRVVFCDAAPYDQGYLAPTDIAGRVKVRGRGGTVLQPGVDLLEQADDFPNDGPLLVITDAMCDNVSVHREHAFLVPNGARLPFVPRGPVFRVTD
jgi:predicted metal-dependent peptidase